MRRERKAGWGRWLAMGMALLAQPAIAQLTPGVTITPSQPSNDPADRLAANLVILSQNPRDVNALTEAGLSAIAVGDGNAALSFLARAEEISPSNGRIKAAIGSALLLMEKPTEALKLFGEAASLGVPEQVIARDRGLAYDLRGDSKRAQRDYALALRADPDDDLTIRYALSLGISGDDHRALELLDPLLRQRNLAAWRARAFVLAMNGDMKGAEGVANTVMPGGSGASMSPFLRRLAILNPAERALAVNFGIMPSDGQHYAMVETGDPYRPSGLGGPSDALIPAGDPLGPRPEDTGEPRRRGEPASKEPRRRPGRDRETLTAARDPSGDGAASPPPDPSGVLSQRVGKRIGPVDPQRLPPEVRAVLKSDATQPAAGERPVQVIVTNATSLPPPSGAMATASPTPPPTVIARASAEPAARFEVPDAAQQAALQTGNAVTPQPEVRTVFTTPITNQLPPEARPEPAIQQVLMGSPAEAQPVPPPAQIVSPPAPVVASGGGLGAFLAGLQTEEESVAGPLPSVAEMKAARLAALRKANAEADARAAKEVKEAERRLAAKSPPRIWVQIATGANESGLPGTWKKLKEKAPAALKGLSPSSVPFKATNRLLVGPFKSQAEARALVNTIGKAGLSGSTFTSEAGQEIAKVSAR